MAATLSQLSLLARMDWRKVLCQCHADALMSGGRFGPSEAIEAAFSPGILDMEAFGGHVMLWDGQKFTHVPRQS